MWNKHINLKDSRKLSFKFCEGFGLIYCQIYMVDVLPDKAWGNYIYLTPPHILILDSYLNINRLGILMHELTHHLECQEYDGDYNPQHGYSYQLAKKRVVRWCKKNISTKPNWNKPLSAIYREDDMKDFKT